MKETITLLIIVTVQQVLVVNTSTYYITPGPYSDENETEEVFLQWSTIQHNISRYFTSHTDIYFLSGEYNFDQHLTISNVNNISIIGKTTVTFKCTSDVAIFINTSIAVTIHNIKFVNCGANATNAVPFLVLSHTVTATISLLNVQSIVLSNITFENSLGHGIVGTNVLGSSTLVNITVYHNNNLSCNSLRPMGGIILVYVDTIDDVHQNNILIKYSTICCMSDQYSLHTLNSKTPLLSATFGLFLHQQTYFVNVEIVDTNITKVVSQNSPLVYFAYNSSMTSSVSIHNSKFTYITSKTVPVMEFELIKNHFNSSKSFASFLLNNSVFSSNTAKLVVFTQFGNYKEVNIKITSTEFTYNKKANFIWKSSHHMPNLTITDCSFKSNDDFNMQIVHIHTVRFINNLFYNNTLQYPQQGLLDISNKTAPIFESNNDFFFNSADVIININLKDGFMYIKEGATLNISCNSAKSNATEKRSLIVFSEELEKYLCRFQFLSNNKKLDLNFTSNTVNFSLIFHNNHNYTSILYGTLLNSCHWLPNGAFHTATPGDVYKRVIQYDTTNNIITRTEATFCYCDKDTGEVDCFRDNFTTTPIYPGQIIPINLIQVPTPEITAAAAYLWRDVSDAIYQHNVIDKPCKLDPYTLPKWRPSDQKTCMPLFYRVLANTPEPCFACFSARGITKFTFYRYYIGFKQNCPPGFELHNNSCDCNKYLIEAFPTLTCDIDTETINRPGLSWIVYNRQGIISYAVTCSMLFCKPEPIKLQLNNLQTQCVGNRAGIQCGHCPHGLSAVFGSFKCKKCSNKMLWLLPVFFIAGILLVFCLFTLNLTVVDGKINGFILYANLTVITNYYIFPSPSLFTVMSLCNLDLGIETCFYHSMTEYDKTWLQFVFPLYLLCIVGVLAITSRYSSCVERLTRKRVIPVIATIFLLSYSKMLQVTTKVLVSHTTIHEVDGNKTEKYLIWMYDSHIYIYGLQFILIFLTCLLVFVFILVPMNFVLIFTKFSYNCNFVSKYLKPYLDACQAPFKINYYYYFGIELLVRAILFVIHDVKVGVYQILTIYIGIWIVIIIYLCTFKPFRNTATAILYMSYILNIVFLVMLVMFYNMDTTNTSYIIVFSTLNIIALAEFGCTVLYYMYTNHLYKIMTVSTLKAKLACVIITFLRWSISKQKDTELQMIPFQRCEQLQEELLTVGPEK